MDTTLNDTLSRIEQSIATIAAAQQSLGSQMNMIAGRVECHVAVKGDIISVYGGRCT